MQTQPRFFLVKQLGYNVVVKAYNERNAKYVALPMLYPYTKTDSVSSMRVYVHVPATCGVVYSPRVEKLTDRIDSVMDSRGDE